MPNPNAKRALITGAARGLGEGIVRRLARDGWSALMTDVNPAVHDTAAAIRSDLCISEEKLIAMQHDVSDSARTEAVVDMACQRFGGIDLAVANAGIGGVEVDLVDLEVADFERVVDM